MPLVFFYWLYSELWRQTKDGATPRRGEVRCHSTTALVLDREQQCQCRFGQAAFLDDDFGQASRGPAALLQRGGHQPRSKVVGDLIHTERSLRPGCNPRVCTHPLIRTAGRLVTASSGMSARQRSLVCRSPREINDLAHFCVCRGRGMSIAEEQSPPHVRCESRP